MNPQLRRIRSADGRVSPLTEAQRAKIITVDLDNPPSFMGVLKNAVDFRKIKEDKQPGIGAWVFRPDWNEYAKLFNRGESIGLLRSVIVNLGYLNDSGWNYGSRIKDAADELRSPLALRFLRNFVVMMEEIRIATNCTKVKMSLAIQNVAEPDVFHADRLDGAFRILTALDHGNTYFPNAVQADAKSFCFLEPGADVVNERVHVIDALEAGIEVATPAMGILYAFRGLGLSQRLGGEIGWHAAYRLPVCPTYSRPLLKADFS